MEERNNRNHSESEYAFRRALKIMNASRFTSTMQAIVDAVPMVLHVPVDLLMPHSAAKNSAWEMAPLLRWACIFHMDVPDPITFLLLLRVVNEGNRSYTEKKETIW